MSLKTHKLISTLFHPLVIPTLGLILFFILSTSNIPKNTQYLLLTIVFVATYVMPLLLLIFLKHFGVVHSFQVETIKERKVPLFAMICIFYALGKFFVEIPYVRELSHLFYGTMLGLVIIYLLFLFRLKTSLHLISMGSALGFFILYSMQEQLNTLPIIACLLLLSGMVASSRLHLKAHTTFEIYLGFFLGIASQVFAFTFFL